MLNDAHARVPVDALAARVVARGFQYDPDVQVLTRDSPTPIPIREIPNAIRNNPSFTDLTGRVFGRFTVLGLARDFNKSWVVRCTCGTYSTRRAKAVLNPENSQDRCTRCRHLAFLKKRDVFLRTGQDIDINNF